MLYKKLVIIIFSTILNNIYAECADLDSSDCILYPEWCLWDNSSSVCQDVSNDTLGFTYDCIPYNDYNPIPTNTTEYAEMCIDYVGVPPTVDCGDGVPIPIYVEKLYCSNNQNFLY